MANESIQQRVQDMLASLSWKLNDRERSAEGKVLWNPQTKAAQDSNGHRYDVQRTEALTKKHVYRK